MSPGQFKQSSTNTPSKINLQAHRSAFIPALARIGLVRLLVRPIGLIPYLPPEVEKAYTSRMVRPGNLKAYLSDESQGMPESGRQADAVKTFGDLPLIVLTARQNNIPGWQEWQTDLLQLSSNSQQLFAESCQNIEIEQPDAAIAAIVKMLELVRRSTSLW